MSWWRAISRNRDRAVKRLDPTLYRDLVRRALAEDLGSGDLTTDATVDPRQRARGVLLAKSPCVLAGLDVAREVFRQADETVRAAVTAAREPAVPPFEFTA